MHRSYLSGTAAGLSLLTLGFIQTAAATPSTTQETAGSHWGLGIGASSKQKAYKDIDRKNRVLPLVSYENRYIQLQGPELAIKLPELGTEGNSLRPRLLVQYDFTGFDAGDAPILNGMEDRKGGLLAGVGFDWQNPLATLRFEATTAAAGDNEGTTVTLGLEKTWQLNKKWSLTPRLAGRWLDKKYVAYYYGVRLSEVRPDRPYYEGKSTFNSELGVRLGYRLTRTNLFLLDAQWQKLGSGIKDSPLTDTSTQSRISLAYIHYF